MDNAEQQLAEKEDKSWVPEWYLARLSEIELMRQATEKRYKELLQDLDSREKQLEHVFGAALRAESDKLIAAERKKKSVKLLTGTVGYRTSGGRFCIEDMDTALQWAKRNLTTDEMRAYGKFDIDKLLPLVPRMGLNGALTELKPSQMKKYMEENDGELPDGCGFTPTVDTFFTKPLQLRLTDGQS